MTEVWVNEDGTKTTVPKVELEAAQVTIADLRVQVDRLQTQVNNLLPAQKAFDIAVETANAKADEDGICKQYDDFIDAINSALHNYGNHLRWPARTKELDIRVEITCTVPSTCDEDELESALCDLLDDELSRRNAEESNVQVTFRG